MAGKIKTVVRTAQILNPKIKVWLDDKEDAIERYTLEFAKKHSVLATYKPTKVNCKKGNGTVEFEVTFDDDKGSELTNTFKKAVMNPI